MADDLLKINMCIGSNACALLIIDPVQYNELINYAFLLLLILAQRAGSRHYQSDTRRDRFE